MVAAFDEMFPFVDENNNGIDDSQETAPPEWGGGAGFGSGPTDPYAPPTDPPPAEPYFNPETGTWQSYPYEAPGTPTSGYYSQNYYTQPPVDPNTGQPYTSQPPPTQQINPYTGQPYNPYNPYGSNTYNPGSGMGYVPPPTNYGTPTYGGVPNVPIDPATGYPIDQRYLPTSGQTGGFTGGGTSGTGGYTAPPAGYGGYQSGIGGTGTGTGGTAYPTGGYQAPRLNNTPPGSNGQSYQYQGGGPTQPGGNSYSPEYIAYLYSALAQNGQIQTQQLQMDRAIAIGQFINQQAQTGVNAYVAQANAEAQFGQLAVQQFTAMTNAANNSGLLSIAAFNAERNAANQQGQLQLGAYSAQNTAQYQQGTLANQQLNSQLDYLVRSGGIQNDAQRNAITAYLGSGQLTNDSQRMLIEAAVAQSNAQIAAGQLGLATQAQAFQQGPQFAAQLQQQQFQQGMDQANLLAQMRGPRNAYVEQNVLHGMNAMGLSNAQGAISGGPDIPTYQAPQATPQPMTLASFYADRGLTPPQPMGQLPGTPGVNVPYPTMQMGGSGNGWNYQPTAPNLPQGYMPQPYNYQTGQAPQFGGFPTNGALADQGQFQMGPMPTFQRMQYGGTNPTSLFGSQAPQITSDYSTAQQFNSGYQAVPLSTIQARYAALSPAQRQSYDGYMATINQSQWGPYMNQIQQNLLSSVTETPEARQARYEAANQAAQEMWNPANINAPQYIPPGFQIDSNGNYVMWQDAPYAGASGSWTIWDPKTGGTSSPTGYAATGVQPVAPGTTNPYYGQGTNVGGGPEGGNNPTWVPNAPSEPPPSYTPPPPAYTPPPPAYTPPPPAYTPPETGGLEPMPPELFTPPPPAYTPPPPAYTPPPPAYTPPETGGLEPMPPELFTPPPPAYTPPPPAYTPPSPVELSTPPLPAFTPPPEPSTTPTYTPPADGSLGIDWGSVAAYYGQPSPYETQPSTDGTSDSGAVYTPPADGSLGNIWDFVNT